jgi:phosphate transport system protein
MNHSNHAFKDLDQSLQMLDEQFSASVQKILHLIALCEQGLGKLGDVEQLQGLLKQARATDKEINQIENENLAVIQNILGKYNPRGKDLRFIIGSIKLATLLESVADKLKNSLKRMLKMEAAPSSETQDALKKMFSETADLMRLLPRLMEEFDDVISGDMARRRREIEVLYRSVWLQKTSVDVNYHNLVMLAKNLERIADLSSDLKKILYFVHTGERLRKKKPVAAE